MVDKKHDITLTDMEFAYESDKTLLKSASAEEKERIARLLIDRKSVV